MRSQKFSNALRASLESQQNNIDTVVAIESLSPRTRAIIKQFTMTASGANVYLGHKAESLAKKIEKIEDQLEELKKAKDAAKDAKVSNESIEVDLSSSLGDASMEGMMGAADGYKGGVDAFWKKDGKISFPSMKRYHAWMESMQVDIDEKSTKLKELKAELKAQLAADAKAKTSTESTTEPLSDADVVAANVIDSPEMVAEAVAPAKPKTSAADAVVKPVMVEKLPATPVAAVKPVEDSPEPVVAAVEPAVAETAVPTKESADSMKEPAMEESADSMEEPAMEADEMIEPEVVIPVEVSEADAVDTDHHMVASSEIAGDVDAAMDEYANITDVANGLESILNMVHQEPNGLTPEGARWVGVAVESYVGKFEMGMSLIPSQESFGGKLSRIEATASLEANVGEVIKQAWAYIVELAKKIYAHVVEFLDRLFDAGKGLKAKAEALKVTAGKLTGSPKEAQIDISSLARAFSIDGKVPSNLVEVFGAIDNIAKENEEENGRQCALGMAIAQAVVKLTNSTDAAFEADYTEAKKQFASMVVVPAMFKKASDGSYRTVTMPGELFYTVDPTSGKFTAHKSEAKVGEVKIATLIPAQITAIANAASVFADNVIQVKAAGKMAKKYMFEAMVKVPKENSGLSGENAKKASVMGRELLAITMSQMQFAIKTYSALAKAGRGVVAVAEKSAAQYGGGAVPALKEGDQS